ncbi:DUF402 domain-containing protein [Psychromicrobium sp. YIM B11713]|uniref:DUF402 domain-containing protein n=1 Tax=Psychromicrobium sp. YIM B11713 TaxID=3145233 RepID=UPI00374F81BB
MITSPAADSFGPAVGDLVVARNRKWDGSPHWVAPGHYLGSDDLGHWVYQSPGAFVSKPGSAFIARSGAALLVPFSGEWVATFYDVQHPNQCTLYVDLVTDIAWHPLVKDAGWELTLIDMDLDVVTEKEHTWIADEDEFAEHQLRYGYSKEVIERIENECARIYQAVLAGLAPFDGREAQWFERAGGSVWG